MLLHSHENRPRSSGAVLSLFTFLLFKQSHANRRRQHNKRRCANGQKGTTATNSNHASVLLSSQHHSTGQCQDSNAAQHGHSAAAGIGSLSRSGIVIGVCVITGVVVAGIRRRRIGLKLGDLGLGRCQRFQCRLGDVLLGDVVELVILRSQRLYVGLDGRVVLGRNRSQRVNRRDKLISLFLASSSL